MTTYRERREARVERLRGWADSREAKADAAYERADSIADMIPFGQPILVGHHSEGRARRDQERIHNGMRASFEHTAKAESMRSRADNIEAAAALAIYSDDPDAIDALEAKIARLEAERDRIKAFNAACRKAKGVTAEALELLDDHQRADYKRTAEVCGYMLGKNGDMPAYHLTNLSGNITRARKRLEQLQRKAARTVLADFGHSKLTRFTCSCGETVELCLTESGPNARRVCLDCRLDADRAANGWTAENSLS